MTYAFHPDLAPWAPVFSQLSFADIPAARAAEPDLVAALPPYVPPVPLDVLEVLVTGPADAPQVRVRVYAPASAAAVPRPGLVYIHGGGFVVGSLDLYDADCRRIAAEVDAVVVSVDYRLAPEHPFPAGLEDCYAALAWLADEADELGVDRDRLAVGGESAGGGLAAGLALLTRDRGGPSLCLQFLGIPELDDRLDTESMRTLVDSPITTVGNGEISWDSYLGAGVRGTDAVSPYAAPARATDLAGLPAALVTAYEFDALRDEGIAYAQRLLSAGVATELHVYPGAFHACTWIADAGVCQQILIDLVDALRRRLHPVVPELVST